MPKKRNINRNMPEGAEGPQESFYGSRQTDTGIDTETGLSVPDRTLMQTSGGRDMTVAENATVAANPAATVPASIPAAVRLPKVKKITDVDVKKAEGILQQYRMEKQALTDRIIENELYYEFVSTSGRPRNLNGCRKFKDSRSAYLFNNIANKHADFMDNKSSPTILPQEESDEETAKILSEVVPCIFDINKFNDTFYREVFDKLIAGTGLYAVTWDGSAYNGLGQISIKDAEILNLFWKGGVKTLEDSPNLFYVTIENNDDLKVRYPELIDKLGNGSIMNVDDYIYEDMPDRTHMSVVVDWYYKKPVLMENTVGGKVVKYQLHYCKFCCGTVLFASENEEKNDGSPAYPDGFYAHGRYPYIMDALFPIKGSPAGFGYVDITKNPQEFIDQIDTACVENARYKAKPRYMAPVGQGFNAMDLFDLDKDIVPVSGNMDQVKPIETPDLPASVLNVLQMKKDELKETSGNTDFAQGTTSSGVTAASAIAALQEAGSKLSRDMIDRSYTAYADICTLIIELIRQFYTTDRVFRITEANEQYSFVHVSGRMLQGDPVRTSFNITTGGRIPYFDIKVDAQKASPFSRAAQNELAKELYAAGMFNAEYADQAVIALEMMQFEGKDAVLGKVRQNQMLLNENVMLKGYIVQFAQLMAMQGDSNTAQLAQAIAQKFTASKEGTAAVPAIGASRNMETDTLGNIQSRNTITDRARTETQNRSEVRSR